MRSSISKDHCQHYTLKLENIFKELAELIDIIEKSQSEFNLEWEIKRCCFPAHILTKLTLGSDPYPGWPTHLPSPTQSHTDGFFPSKHYGFPINMVYMLLFKLL